MNLIRYKEAGTYEVEKWLETKLNLTVYQKEILRRDELVRFSPFRFVKHIKQSKSNPLWRLTIIFVPVVWLLIVISMLFKFLITGDFYWDYKLIEKYYYGWLRKLNLKY